MGRRVHADVRRAACHIAVQAVRSSVRVSEHLRIGSGPALHRSGESGVRLGPGSLHFWGVGFTLRFDAEMPHPDPPLTNA